MSKDDTERFTPERPRAPAARIYDDPCGAARALNLVGERWALLVVRELLLGPKRFSDLRRGLATISPNVLSQRLRELERAGVVAQRQLGPPVGATVYELTDRGEQLRPVLSALAGWGSRTAVRSTRELSPDALVLALQTTVDATRPPLEGAFVLRLGADAIAVRFDGHTVTATRSPTESPTATISADVSTVRAVVFGDRDPADALRAGQLAIDGDTVAALAFLCMFSRPPVDAPTSTA